MPLIHKIDHPKVEGIRVGRTGPRGNYRINTTCIVYRLGDTIIDTGPTKEWRTVRRFLEERGVRQALLTHYHEDHSGNCGHVQDCFNTVVHSHINNHEKLSSGYDLNLFSKLIFGDITFSNPSEFPDTVETDNGHQFRALHMPGHSDDMTTFYEPNEGWLFSGDLYVSSKVRYAFADESISEQISSLKAAVALDFNTLFCAHQGLIQEGKQALQKKLDHLTSLQQEVRHLHQKGWSEKAITRKLLGREDFVSWFSGFAMSKGNLIRACLYN